MRRTPSADPAPLRIEEENEWAWCGERRLDLTPRAFAVLRHLVSNAGRLVTKRELLDSVWSATVVSEAALASCIRDLRKALGDSSREPLYLETVHRRGFRFIGPVAPARAPAESAHLGVPTRGEEARSAASFAARPGDGGPLPGGATTALASSVDRLGARPVDRPGAGLVDRIADRIVDRLADRFPDRPLERLVGREADLARLHALLAAAHDGRRRVVFVTGEAGIGKTTLVEAFLAELASEGGLRIGRGQCVEQYGAGEAYLPVLEALGRLGRDPGGEALVEILRRYAPSWLAQLPALLRDEDLEAVRRRAQGSTRERMLRELIEALDAIASEAPLVLVLEDLHWSDSATVDLLAMLARRRDPARLLIVGTYRPADVAAPAHPLRPVKQELQAHGDCEELALAFLGEAAVRDYVAARFGGSSLAPELAPVLQRNTGGNPLFLASVVEDLIERGQVRAGDGGWELAVPLAAVAAEVPETLAQMIEKQIERTTEEEQAVLAVASVAGAEFSAALAAADGNDVEAAERFCAGLARRGQLLRALGAAEWPDGTVAGRYGFIHALYRNVLYARVPIVRRVGLHRWIGARLEEGYGERAAEVAGELAMHFEEGRDVARAVRYREHAASGALRQHAHREAASHATRALELLATRPESPERLARELALQTTLGAALIPQGPAAPDVVRTYARAHELCSRVGDVPELFPALVGLTGYSISRAELAVAREVADRFSTLARATDDEAVLLGAHNAAGTVSFYAGELAAAVEQLERGLVVYDPGRHGPGHWAAFWAGHDPGVWCASHAAWALWALGRPERAAARMRDALGWAREAAYPYTLANACSIAAVLHACRRDREAARDLADEAVRHSEEHGFQMLADIGAIVRGWLLAEDGVLDEGAEQVRAAVRAYREMGAGIGTPTFLGFLAEAERRRGRVDEALAVVADALAMSEASGAHYWDAELRRLQGEALLATRARPGLRRVGKRSGGGPVERGAESSFRSALEIAQRQQARSLELRAATSLARLWREQSRAGEARALLWEVYGALEEGFEVPDAADARALLEELGGARPH